MQISEPTINASFLRGFSELVLSRGGELTQLLKSAGIDSEVMANDTQFIHLEKFVLLLEGAAQQLMFPNLSLELAARQDAMVLAPMAAMLSRCNDVSDAMDIIVKSTEVLVGGYHIDIEEKTDCHLISFRCELPQIVNLVQYQDYALASAVNVLHSLAGTRFPLRACYFIRAEANQARRVEYAEYFNSPIVFAHDQLAVVVDKGIFDQPVGHLSRNLTQQVQRSVRKLRGDFPARVTKVIELFLANGECRLDDVARSIGYSERSLQRRLGEHKTSYRKLLDAVRFELANQYLKNTEYRITDIATMLGYSNLSAFSRSYYRLCGFSPQQIRLNAL